MARLRLNNISASQASNPLAFANAGATTGTWTTAPPIPTVAAPDYVPIVIDPELANFEIVYLTAYTAGATSGTFIRGREGTTSVAHAASGWKHGATAIDYNYSTLWTRNGLPNANDDEFQGTTINPAWVQVIPSGAMTVQQGGDCLSMKVTNNAAAGVCALVKPINGLTIGNSIETCSHGITNQNYLMRGLVLSDGTAVTNNVVWERSYSVLNGRMLLSSNSGTFTNGSTGSNLTESDLGMMTGPFYQRITWLAANTWRFSYSCDGVLWSTFGRADMSFTMTPTHMGLASSTWTGAGDSLASYEYFRVV